MCGYRHARVSRHVKTRAQLLWVRSLQGDLGVKLFVKLVRWVLLPAKPFHRPHSCSLKLNSLSLSPSLSKALIKEKKSLPVVL